MPIIDILVLCVITFAFIIFAVTLAWGDYQTREIARASRQRALTGTHVATLKRNAQADNVEHKAGAGRRTPARA